MQMFPNPVANVAAKVPGLAQAAAGLQFAASPLFTAQQGTYHTGEGSLFGLGAIETWRRTSPPPVLGGWETWRTSGLGRLAGGLGRLAVNPDMVSLGQAEAAAAAGEPVAPDMIAPTNGNGMVDPTIAAQVGGAAIAITVAAGVAGAIFGAVHGYTRHKKSVGWSALWGTAGLLFPGYTIAAGVAQRQVTGWKRGG